MHAGKPNENPTARTRLSERSLSHGDSTWVRRSCSSLLPFAALAIIAALWLSGCTTVGPDYVKPEAPVGDKWIEEKDPKVKAQPADHSQWWTVFNDPVLTSLVEKAYNQNLDLQIAGLRILEARAVLGIAAGEQYPQSQDLTGGYARTQISRNTANTPPGINTSFDSFRAGFDAAWELDFWGRFRRGIEAADAELFASIANYDDLLVTLLAEVAATYVDIRTFERRIELARQNVKIQKRSLEIAEARFKGGAVTELDVQQAKSLLRDTEAAIPALQTGLRRAQNALSILLGIVPRDLMDILGGPRAIPTPPAQVAVGIPAELLRRRPDIQRAELQAAAQSARIGVAKADLYPRFSLAGFVGVESEVLNDFLKSGSFTGFISPTIRWPILNYGRIRNSVRVQDARFQQLIVNYQNTVLRAYQEVEDSLVGFLRSQEQVGYLGDSVKASERAVDLSLLQYREGVADYQRVLDSQRFLVSEQDKLAAAEGDVPRNLIATYKALGGGWQIREGRDFVKEETQEIMRTRTNWGRLLSPEALAPKPINQDILPPIPVRLPDF